MSQENIKLYFEAKDHEGFSRLVHPDATVTVLGLPEPGPFLGSESGVETHADVIVAYRVKDRQLFEVHWLGTREEALEAAGLQE
jgi:hypothetical protein